MLAAISTVIIFVPELEYVFLSLDMQVAELAVSGGITGCLKPSATLLSLW